MPATPSDRCPTCGEKKPLLSIKAAALLANVNRKTIYRWIRTGLLPYRKLPSGSIRVREDDLLEIPRKPQAKKGGGRGGGAQGGTMAIGGTETKAARGRGPSQDEE